MHDVCGVLPQPTLSPQTTWLWRPLHPGPPLTDAMRLGTVTFCVRWMASAQGTGRTSSSCSICAAHQAQLSRERCGQMKRETGRDRQRETDTQTDTQTDTRT